MEIDNIYRKEKIFNNYDESGFTIVQYGKIQQTHHAHLHSYET